MARSLLVQQTVISPRPILLLLVMTATCVGVVGCESPTSEEGIASFRQALPQDADLEIGTPIPQPYDPAGVAKMALGEDGTEGSFEVDLSGFMANTAARLDATIAAVLVPVHKVMQGRPRFVSDSRAIWNARPGDGFSYVLAVQRFEDGHFTFRIASRPFPAGGAEWSFRAAGNWTPVPGVKRGRGTIHLDLDADASQHTTGKLWVEWSYEGGVREVEARMWGASPNLAVMPAYDAIAFFHVGAGAGGVFQYAAAGRDVVSLEANDGAVWLEDIALAAAWNAAQAGRVDAYIRAGDLARRDIELAVVSQCWRPGFAYGYEQVALTRPPEDEKIARHSGEIATCAAWPERVTYGGAALGAPPEGLLVPPEVDDFSDNVEP